MYVLQCRVGTELFVCSYSKLPNIPTVMCMYISSVGLDLNLHVLQQILFIGISPVHLQEESLSEVQLFIERL